MRKFTIIALLFAALTMPAVRAADVTEADYQKAMKATNEGMQTVGKVLAAGGTDLSGAVAGAKAIEAALASIESFWEARKDAEAVKMNSASRAAALALAKVAEGNELEATKEARKALGATCKACHDVHREQLPDKTYKIK